MQTVKRITSNIYQVGGPSISYSHDSAVYLIDVGDILLIDAGVGIGFKEIVNNIRNIRYEPNMISALILTHCHADHIEGARYFKRYFNLPLVMHELDAKVVERGDNRLTAAFCFDVRFFPFKIDIKLSGESGNLSYRNAELEWIHTPGHTAGSISLIMKSDGLRVLFAQDIGAPLLKEFECDPIAWRRSINKLISLNADILCDGHTGAFAPAEVVREYLEYFSELYKQDAP